MQSVEITVHKAADETVHCWFSDPIPAHVEDQIESIEGQVFRAERDQFNAELLDNLPTEGSYDHDPIVVGSVDYTPAEMKEVHIDLEEVEAQLKSHGYL